MYEPDYRQSFWGSNYARLARIKRRVDPNNVFQVWHGVEFDESSPLFTCYREERDERAIGMDRPPPLVLQRP